MDVKDAANTGVIFDDAGDSFPAHPLYLAARLGQPAGEDDLVAYAVQRLGFVHVAPIRNALLIRFDPSTVHHLAASAAFYEVGGRAPKRLILATPGKAGSPDRYEIFNNIIEGLRRLETALHRDHGVGARIRKSKPVAAGLGAGGQAPGRTDGSDHSKRLTRTLDSISSRDRWFGQSLNGWRNARAGWRLPSTQSLDTLELLNIARGRAHVVDTHDSDPERYRFRVWGTVNSYRGGNTNKCLCEMPPGLMRDEAIEDYWEVATTGVPTYQLITHIEKKTPYSYARLLLPFAADGRRVDHLMVLINERLLPEFKET